MARNHVEIFNDSNTHNMYLRSNMFGLFAATVSHKEGGEAEASTAQAASVTDLRQH
jgi:hypothetical protein